MRLAHATTNRPHLHIYITHHPPLQAIDFQFIFLDMIGTITTPSAGYNLRLSPPIRKVRVHPVLKAKLVVEHTTPARRDNLYEVLHVKRNASPLEIKTAYRNLSKLYHPDASTFNHHGDNDFIEIHNAYAMLSDPESRAMYDLTWNNGLRQKTGLSTAVGKKPQTYTSRRWETDQCW